MDNWNYVPFAFANGLNTKFHPQQLPLGALSVLENGIFTNTGAINKRNGYSQLSNLILGQAEHISQAKASAVYNQIDLLTFDGNNVFSWIPSMTKWSDRGNCTAVAVKANNINPNSYQQTNPDVIAAKGVELYAWDDSRGGIRYSIIDATTKSYLISDQSLDPTGQHPQCCIFGDYLMIVYQTTAGQIIGALIAPGNPSSPTSYFLASDANLTNVAFAIGKQESLNSFYLTYNTQANSTKLNIYNTILTLQTSVENSGDAVAMTLFFQSNNNVVVSYGNSNNEVAFYSYNSTLTAPVITPTVLDTGKVVSHITGMEYDSINHLFQLYFDDVSGARPYVQSLTCAADGTNINSSLLMRSVSLVSQLWQYNNRIYINTVFNTSLQPTYFTLSSLGEVISKVQDSVAGGFRSASTLANINTINAGEFLFANEHKGSILSQNNINFELKGVASANLQFINSYKSAMLGNVLHLTGGILQAYDGNKIVEHGFNVFPEDVGNLPGFVGLIADGTYTWQFTYEWTNNVGDVERSAPSKPITLTLNNVTNSVLFTIPALNLTKKPNVRIVAYRTREASTGDSLLYQVSSVISPTLNNPNNNFILFVDNLNDSSIQSNNVLYCSPDTNGQLIELENISAPNCTIITSYKNRIFIAGLDNPNQLWYSKTIVPGEPAAFSDSLILDIDPRGGDVTGLAVMDANLIIFKKESIFLMSGIGPTNTGAQNDFIDPQMVASDVGCINQNSIVLVADKGLFFQSSKGIYLLERTLQSSYVGSPVQDFNNQTIVSATQIPGTTQVRFLCNDGNALVYDYFVQQWTTFTNHIAVDAGVWQDKFYFLTSLGIVNQEVINQFSDGTVPINMQVATGWIHLGNLLNYQVANSFLFLGQYFGAHKLLVEIGYNGNENLIAAKTIDTSTVINPHVYGQQNIYGNNSPYGGIFSEEIFRVFFKFQKCRSFKIRITEIQGDIGNQGLTLIGLNMRYKALAGMDKVSANNQTGVS